MPVDVIGSQIQAEVARGAMRPIDPRQFLVNLFSLCVFPFVARPILRVLFQMDDDGFAAFIEERKRELPIFFMNAIRPQDE